MSYQPFLRGCQYLNLSSANAMYESYRKHVGERDTLPQLIMAERHLEHSDTSKQAARRLLRLMTAAGEAQAGKKVHPDFQRVLDTFDKKQSELKIRKWEKSTKEFVGKLKQAYRERANVKVMMKLLFDFDTSLMFICKELDKAQKRKYEYKKIDDVTILLSLRNIHFWLDFVDNVLSVAKTNKQIPFALEPDVRYLQKSLVNVKKCVTTFAQHVRKNMI